MYPSRRITVRVKEPSAEDPTIVWLDVGPGECDLGVYPAESSPRLDRQELTLLHAAVGHILEAGGSLTVDSMVRALAGLEGRATPSACRCG